MPVRKPVEDYLIFRYQALHPSLPIPEVALRLRIEVYEGRAQQWPVRKVLCNVVWIRLRKTLQKNSAVFVHHLCGVKM